jgi:drug/metabolite transporter (DMT)-like permease
MMAVAHNRRIAGIISLCLGVLVFSTQDAILKSISHDYAVSEAIAIRCTVALPILLAMVHAEAGIKRIISPNYRAMAVRGAIMLVAYTSYFMALPALPLAQAIALYFCVPILITIMSGPLLGETIRLGTWAAVIVGFFGVLIIVQPGTSLFEPAALLSLISAATYAFSMILARKLGVEEPSTVMSFYQNAVYLVGALLMASLFGALGIHGANHPSIDFLVRPWVMPSQNDLLLMAACGVIAALGMSLLTHAYRSAQASIVTVFEYTGMIWGPLWGYLFFSEIPKWTTVMGTVLIIAAGIFAMRSAAAVPLKDADASA